jgi:hypothetical protein
MNWQPTTPNHQPTRTPGKNWQLLTTPTTSTAPLASPPGVAVDTDNAVGLVWRCGERIAIDLNPIIEGIP